jgi:hypothetical protein
MEGRDECAFDLHRHLANRQTSRFPVGSCPFSLQFASSVTFSNRGPTILRDCVDLLTSNSASPGRQNDTREMKGKTGSLQKAAWLKVGIRKASDQAVDDGSSSEFNC